MPMLSLQHVMRQFFSLQKCQVSKIQQSFRATDFKQRIMTVVLPTSFPDLGKRPGNEDVVLYVQKH